jgi:hypothetical protein
MAQDQDASDAGLTSHSSEHAGLPRAELGIGNLADIPSIPDSRRETGGEGGPRWVKKAPWLERQPLADCVEKLDLC